MKKTCEVCKKDFHVSPSHAPRNFCCSKPCSNKRKKVTQSGKNNHFYGKKHSEATKRKNSVAHLGQRAWNKGKTGIYSEEHLQKIRIARSRQIGEKHPMWGGGRRMHNGYILIYSPNHPCKNKNNTVHEHRLVMEKHLGRYLFPEEVVHHRNRIKTDNRVENLELFENNSKHLLEHSRMGTIKGRPRKFKQ